MLEILSDVFTSNPLIVSFAVIGLTMYLSYVLSNKLTRGRIHGSAIAIILGLILAYIGGVVTGGEKGLSDISVFAGIGLMGGGMLRDFAIVATSFGASFSEIKKAGINGIVALFVGVILSLCHADIDSRRRNSS